MWSLVPTSNATVSFWLICAKDYLLGRKDADIVLPDDKSISRAHAYLTIGSMERAKAKDFTYRPKIVIKDTSKFGTFVNGEQMKTGHQRQLEEGDVLHFGDIRKDIKYQLTWFAVNICCSSIPKDQIQSVTDMLMLLGAHVCDAIDNNCTHLLTSEIRAVLKTVLALVYGVPFVGVHWLTAALQRSDCSKPLPEPSLYLPPVHAGWDTFDNVRQDDFKVNMARQNLFSHICFLFLDRKAMEANAPLIHAAKGLAVCESTPAIPAILLQYPSAVVVQADDANNGNPTYEELRQVGYQVIDSKVLYEAILHANIDAIHPRSSNPFTQEASRYTTRRSVPTPVVPVHPVATQLSEITEAQPTVSVIPPSTITGTEAVSIDRGGSTPNLHAIDAEQGTPNLQGLEVAPQVPGATSTKRSTPIHPGAIHAEDVDNWIGGRGSNNFLVQETFAPLVVKRQRQVSLPYHKWKPSMQSGTKNFRKQRLLPKDDRFIAVVDAADLFYTRDKAQLFAFQGPINGEDDVEFMANRGQQEVTHNFAQFPPDVVSRKHSPPRRTTTSQPKKKKTEAQPPLQQRKPLRTHPVPKRQPALFHRSDDVDEFGAFARQRESQVQASHDTFDFNED